MLDRRSALEGHIKSGTFGDLTDAGPQVTFTEIKDLDLWQVAAWPDSLSDIAGRVAKAVGTDNAPDAGQSASGDKAIAMRIDPLKYWVMGLGKAPLARLASSKGSQLDISHSRTVIRIEGPNSAELLNRFIPVDLRDQSFAVGSFTSSWLHHVNVHFLRTETGFDLFIPRGFAVSTWEALEETAAQWGYQVN